MGSHAATTMTLANSIIGVSILAMPFCFKQCGIVLSVLMLLLSSFLSRLACYFLLKAAVMARRRNFEFLAFHTFGPSGKFAAELCIIGFLMGTCIAFFVVVGDLGPAILEKILGIEGSSTLRTFVLVGLAVFVVLPLGLLRNVESLAVICTATIGFYICLVLKIIWEAMPHLVSGVWIDRVHFWEPSGILQCIPIFSMALFCQTQLFEIYESLPNATLDTMNEVIKAAVNICTGVYICVGFFGYVAFCNQNFTGNILMSFSATSASDIIKMGFVLSVAVSFPLVIFPCRASLYSLLFRRVGVPYHDVGTGHIPENRFKCLTVFIIGIALTVGLLIPNIELVLGLVGSTIGVLICVIFPAATFICISSKHSTERLLAQVLLFMGVLMLVLGSYATLYAANEIDNNEKFEKEFGVDLPPHHIVKEDAIDKDIMKKIDEMKGNPAIALLPIPTEKHELIKNVEQEVQNNIEIPQNIPPAVIEEPKRTSFQHSNKNKDEKGEEVNQDAIKKEEEELAEAEKQENAELKKKDAELLQKLKKHEQEQIKLIEEQKQILQALEEHKERDRVEEVKEKERERLEKVPDKHSGNALDRKPPGNKDESGVLKNIPLPSGDVQKQASILEIHGQDTMSENVQSKQNIALLNKVSAPPYYNFSSVVVGKKTLQDQRLYKKINASISDSILKSDINRKPLPIQASVSNMKEAMVKDNLQVNKISKLLHPSSDKFLNNQVSQSAMNKSISSSVNKSVVGAEVVKGDGRKLQELPLLIIDRLQKSAPSSYNIKLEDKVPKKDKSVLSPLHPKGNILISVNNTKSQDSANAHHEREKRESSFIANDTLEDKDKLSCNIITKLNSQNITSDITKNFTVNSISDLAKVTSVDVKNSIPLQPTYSNISEGLIMNKLNESVKNEAIENIIKDSVLVSVPTYENIQIADSDAQKQLYPEFPLDSKPMPRDLKSLLTRNFTRDAG